MAQLDQCEISFWVLVVWHLRFHPEINMESLKCVRSFENELFYLIVHTFRVLIDNKCLIFSVEIFPSNRFSPFTGSSGSNKNIDIRFCENGISNTWHSKSLLYPRGNSNFPAMVGTSSLKKIGFVFRSFICNVFCEKSTLIILGAGCKQFGYYG